MIVHTVFVQNIVTPYRNRFFNKLVEKMNDFSVYYMGESEPDRNWDVSQFTMNYPYWIDNHGKYVKCRDFHAHINPRLVWKILFNKSIKNVILAVSWADPNIMAICFARKFHLTKKRLFFWAEANYTAEWAKKHNSKFKWWLKRQVFSSIDGAMIIPGRMSEISFEKWGIQLNKTIVNPNTIDDSSLRYVNKNKNDNGIPHFIMPIRLIEHVKGAINFFKAIGTDNIKQAIFHVAGDGEDRDLYLSFIQDNGLENSIIMEGFCDASRMSELYNMADAMVLPSFSDPSPLSVVEALFFHLPILCSDHCGNHYEAVEYGKNGYTFSPLNTKEIKETFELFMSRRQNWAEMGSRSASIYNDLFETERVIDRFVSQFEIMRQ